MTSSRLYRNGNLEDDGFDLDTAGRLAAEAEHAGDRDVVVWVDLDRPDEATMRRAQELFGLNDLAVEDVLQERQRPKLDRYPRHLFLALHDVEVRLADFELTVTEVDAFIGEHFLLTAHHDPFDAAELVDRWDRAPDPGKHGTARLLHGLVDLVVDSHAETVDRIEDELEALEDTLFDDEGCTPVVQRRSYAARKALVSLRRVVVPTRRLVERLMRDDLGLVTQELEPFWRDVEDHALRSAEETEALRDIVASIVDTTLTFQANRENEVMKRVSSWAALIAVPTLITGYYGINVDTWPAQGTFEGGIVVLVAVVVISGGLYTLFRRNDWL